MEKRIIIFVALLLVGVTVYLFKPFSLPDVSPVAAPEVVTDDSVLNPSPAQPQAPAKVEVKHVHESSDTESNDAPQHRTPTLEPEIRDALGELLNTSSEGLVEETRNGVTRVHLQRRFQTAPVATIDESGEVHITDYSRLPPERP